jgi:hypothetical protein
MATGRIRRSARRGLAVAALGWLGVAALSVVMAPDATAATTYTVHIRDLTPPVASVDQGGKVTFINEIPDKTVQVGGGGLVPSLVSVTAKTVVTLTLPSGDHKLTSAPDPTKPPQESVFTEGFSSTCVTCKISYTYALSSGSSLTSALTQAAMQALPALPPVPTPFVVNTLIPLPNLPSVNLPKLPPVTVPVPTLPGVPGTPAPPVAPPGAPNPNPGTTPTPVPGIGGNQYTYETGGAGTQLAPARVAAAPAFDPSRLALAGGSSSGSGRGSSGSTGSGGLAGGYDGASVPVFGQLAGLNGSGLDDKSDTRDASSSTPTQTLPAAALAAVIALAAVTAALVRTHQASRASR